MRIGKKAFVRVGGAIILVLAILTAARLWYLEEQGNFHCITPGEAYRSAQMDRDEWEYYLPTYGIRSVISLRGPSPNEAWHEEETAICREAGVMHFDLKLSPSAAPSPREMEDLLNAFRTAPRPVLIHCQAGADRSGLAAAIWKVAIDNAPPSVAKKEFSIRFGHMPFGPTQALDSFFDKWVAARQNDPSRQPPPKAAP